MTPLDSDYARTYAAMADEELAELARESASLLEPARRALQLEMEKRGLKIDTLHPAKIEQVRRCHGCGREVTDPLTCGSCATTICRLCGTPLELEWSDDDDLTADDDFQASGQAAGS